MIVVALRACISIQLMSCLIEAFTYYHGLRADGFCLLGLNVIPRPLRGKRCLWCINDNIKLKVLLMCKFWR